MPRIFVGIGTGTGFVVFLAVQKKAVFRVKNPVWPDKKRKDMPIIMAIMKKIVVDVDGREYMTVSRYSPALDLETGEYRLLSRSALLRTAIDGYPDSISDIDLGRMIRLSTYAIPKSGLLARRSHGVLKVYDVHEIIDVLKLKRSVGYQFLRRVQDLSMLRRIDINMNDGKIERQWYLSPLYFPCVTINTTTYGLWHDQIDFELPQYVKTFYAGRKEKINA